MLIKVLYNYIYFNKLIKILKITKIALNIEYFINQYFKDQAYCY